MNKQYMEYKSYKWFLNQLVLRKSQLKILDVGVCRGDKLNDWFSTDITGIVIKNTTKITNRTKYLLIHFLNTCVPMLEKYDPNKVICYLYHKEGKRLVLAKEVVELAENQLHGLQVRSIHMALTKTTSKDRIYKIKAWNEQGELHTEILFGKFTREGGEIARDVIVGEKAMWLTMNITETVYHTKSQFIESLSFDMVVDQASQIHLLNIHELVFRKDKSNTMTSEFRFRRKSLIRVRPDEDQSSDSLSDEGEFDESPRKTPLFSFFNKDTLAKKTHRDQNRYKISLERENKSSSPVFLNMIANTIDKQRRIQANAQLLKAKGLKSQPSLNKRMLFKMTTFKTLRGLNSDSRNIQSFRDLLYYVERTRPRNWIKDKPKDTNEPNFRNIFISTDRHQRHNTIDTDFSTPCTIRHRKTQSNLESNKPGEAFKLWLQHEEARLLAKHSKAQSPVSNLNDKP